MFDQQVAGYNYKPYFTVRPPWFCTSNTLFQIIYLLL